MGIQKQIQFLETTLEKRDSKYRRNFNRYVSNGFRREDIWNLYGNPLGWVFTQSDSDMGVIPNINVLRSCIQTSISKLSQTKVRPLFTPVMGTYETSRVCKSAQIFFDEFFEVQEVYKKGILAVRDSEIFDHGLIWVDDLDAKVKNLKPWEFYVDPAEIHHGRITQCLIKLRSYPLIYLKEKIKKSTYGTMLQESQNLKGTYKIYFNFETMERFHLIGDEEIYKEKIPFSIPPVVPFFFETPIRGSQSTSMIDNLLSLQFQVDSLSQKIHDSIEISPFNSVFVQKGSGVKGSVVSNQAGNVYEVNPSPNGGLAMQVVTPPPIDPSYTALLEMYKNQMYEMEGISQLSAQSKKPSGLNSGVALDTLQDVESERHNVILQNYIRFLMDIARVTIEVFPEDANLLPDSKARASGVKFKDVKKQRELFNIQFSSSSSLSKDPKTKMEQLEKLIAMKAIPADMIPKFLDMPDLDGAYSTIAAAFDDNEKIIERAIEFGQYDFYEVTNLQGLYSQAVNRLLRLDANDEKEEYKVRVVNLLNKIKEVMDGVNGTLQPPPPPPAPVEPQKVAQLVEIASRVNMGQITPDQARAIVSVALPGLPPDLINGMIMAPPQPVPTEGV